jgi:predicted nucleic acid-binding protein
MRPAVGDSGPFIHLSIAHQIDLLPHYFQPLLTLQQVYDEVVTHGARRHGARELARAVTQGDVHLAELTDPEIITHVQQPSGAIPAVSDVDLLVLALAVEQRTILLTDDNALRLLAATNGIPVIGSIGILVRARLDGVIPALKPVLDQLVQGGFYLDPQGQVYREALQRVGES